MGEEEGEGGMGVGEGEWEWEGEWQSGRGRVGEGERARDVQLYLCTSICDGKMHASLLKIRKIESEPMMFMERGLFILMIK